MMSGGVRDVEIPVCNVDLSTRTSCVHDLVTFWASHADLRPSKRTVFRKTRFGTFLKLRDRSCDKKKA